MARSVRPGYKITYCVVGYRVYSPYIYKKCCKGANPGFPKKKQSYGIVRDKAPMSLSAIQGDMGGTPNHPSLIVTGEAAIGKPVQLPRMAAARSSQACAQPTVRHMTVRRRRSTPSSSLTSPGVPATCAAAASRANPDRRAQICRLPLHRLRQWLPLLFPVSG
jgi:hypothetical protein